MNRSRTFCAALLLALAAFAGVLPAQVSLKRGAVIYHGSASNTSAPAVLDEQRAREATPEWKRMQSEGIDPDSAHGKQLRNQMTARIKQVAREVAADTGNDLVVGLDDISDRQGKEVADLTDRVVAKLSL